MGPLVHGNTLWTYSLQDLLDFRPLGVCITPSKKCLNYITKPHIFTDIQVI